MPWDPTLKEDGDAATAASVNDAMTAAEVWLNDLTRDAFRAGAVGREHADSLFHRCSPVTKAYEGANSMLYTFATFGASITYTTFGADTASDTAGVYVGDRAVLGHPDCPAYAGGIAAVTLNSGNGYRVGTENGHEVSAILALLSCELTMVNRNATATTSIMVCLQFQTNGAGWWTIDVSERFVSTDDHKVVPATGTEVMLYPIDIATLITPDVITGVGLDPAADRVTGVRAAVSMVNAGAGMSFTFNSYVVTAVPLYTAEVA